jgi:hypothetical protein
LASSPMKAPYTSLALPFGFSDILVLLVGSPCRFALSVRLPL